VPVPDVPEVPELPDPVPVVVDPVLLPELLEKPPPHPTSRLKKKITEIDEARTKRRERGPIKLLQQRRPGIACLFEYSDGPPKMRVACAAAATSGKC
jgi:hypothetical protein